MKKRYIIIGIIIGIIIIGGIIAMIINNSKKENINQDEDKYSKGTHHAQITIKDYGAINVELYADIAPITVANFAKLVNEGFYNGLTFHRIISGFMIQGGDPNGNGTGGSDENIKGEFAQNGVKNTLSHTRGVISMARADYTSYSSQLTTESYNSAGSQFFINTASNTSLDGSYATFGKVIEGLDVVHAIENVEVKASSKSTNSDSDSGSNTEVSTPVNDVIISNVTVETYGVDYGKPKTLDVWDYYDWVYKTYGINLKSYNSGK